MTWETADAGAGVRLVVLGKQGAGKGTQCVRLAQHYVVPHISTGDMFRAAVKAGTEYGLKAKAYMDAGDLVPDEVVIGIVNERLREPDADRGFILDGFPRTAEQAAALAEMLGPKGVELVIDLVVSDEVVLPRLTGRRVCSDCGANYHLLQPPKQDWTCDVCDGKVVQRPDDTEAAILRRLALYREQTAPLAAWYAERGLLESVDGTGSPDEVAAQVVEVVEAHRSHP